MSIHSMLYISIVLTLHGMIRVDISPVIFSRFTFRSRATIHLNSYRVIRLSYKCLVTLIWLLGASSCGSVALMATVDQETLEYCCFKLHPVHTWLGHSGHNTDERCDSVLKNVFTVFSVQWFVLYLSWFASSLLTELSCGCNLNHYAHLKFYCWYVLNGTIVLILTPLKFTRKCMVRMRWVSPVMRYRWLRDHPALPYLKIWEIKPLDNNSYEWCSQGHGMWITNHRRMRGSRIQDYRP